MFSVNRNFNSKIWQIKKLSNFNRSSQNENMEQKLFFALQFIRSLDLKAFFVN